MKQFWTNTLTLSQQSLVVFKALALASLMVASVILVAILAAVLPLERRVNIATAQLLDCTVSIDGKTKGNPACLQSQILAITGSTKATMGAVAKAMPEIATSLAAASANSVEASRATVTTANSINALVGATTSTVDELHATIAELHASVSSLTKDASVLLKSSDGTIQETGAVMVNLAALAKTLDHQIEAQSPEIANTLLAMQALLSDPYLTDTIKHVDGIAGNMETGTKHLSDFTETVDIATRDLRKKAGQVKWLIDKLLNIVKVTVPIF